MSKCQSKVEAFSNHRTSKGRTRRRRHEKTLASFNRAVVCADASVHINLSRWMKHNTHGYRWKSKILPAHFPGTGRGLMTTVPLMPGDVVISVPENLLITQNTVMNSAAGDVILKSGNKFPRQQLICLFLMFQYTCGSDSFWLPYMNVLPRTYSTPAYFTDEELSLLPRRLFLRAKKEIQKLQTCFNTLSEFCVKWWTDMVDMFTYDLFRWAWYSINSRSVYFKTNCSPNILEDDNHLALAPYLDLLNHLPSAKISAGFNPATRHYEIKTYDRYKKYDQVFICYGPHDNVHLLLEYGFTVPDNPHDVFEIDYDEMMDTVSTIDVTNIEKKADIIRSHNLASKLSCNSEGLSWSLLVTLRIFAMTWSELKNWKAALSGDKISDRNEICVKNIAKIIVEKYLAENADLLGKFPDESIQSEHQRLVYTIVKSDHKILTAAVQFVNNM